MSPGFRLRKDRAALPIIVEGEETSSGPSNSPGGSSFVKRFGRRGSNRAKGHPRVKTSVHTPALGQPHIVIRVETEDRSDLDSQSNYRRDFGSESRNATSKSNRDGTRQVPLPLKPRSRSHSGDELDVSQVRGEHQCAQSSEAERGDTAISSKSSVRNDQPFDPFANDVPAGAGEKSLVLEDDEDQWVAFDDVPFSHSNSSISFFGADITPDPSMPLQLTLSDHSVPGLLRSSTNHSSRSHSRASHRSMDVDELFRKPAQSNSLLSSSLRSPSLADSSLSVPNADSEKTVRTAHNVDARDPDKDDDDGYQSDDSVKSILGDYDPNPEPIDAEECSESYAEGENVMATDDQVGSTYAEDGSYDTTDIGTDEDDEGTGGYTGTDTEGGFETDDSATLIDMIGEAVVALWDDMGPKQHSSSRQRSGAAYKKGHQRVRGSEKDDKGRSAKRERRRSEKGEARRHETGKSEKLKVKRSESHRSRRRSYE